MGPPSNVSEMGSIAGSITSSEWGREYEDEDTWYEWSSNYQAGPDTALIPRSVIIYANLCKVSTALKSHVISRFFLTA